MSTSKHANNKTKNVLVLGRDFVQEIDDTTTSTGQMYSPNFTVEGITFCLSLHYNGDNSYLYANGKMVIKFKANAQDFKATQRYVMCLGNISSDFNQADRISTGLNGYVYDFIVDYWAIANDKILDIHKYLMEKNNIV